MYIRPLNLKSRALAFSAKECGAGPVVLCLHGFPDNEDSFSEQMLPLAAAGFRVVAVRLRGYEPSSQPPDGDYRVASLVDDVLAWIDALGEGPVHLLGHDWGATIAYATAVAAPARVKSLIVMSVPHPGRFEGELRRNRAQMRASWYLMFFQLPMLPEWWLMRRKGSGLRKLWQAWSPGWRYSGQAFDVLVRVMGEPGVLKSSLAYYRQAIDRKSAAGKRSGSLLAAAVPVPTLGLIGQRDGCILPKAFLNSMRGADFPAGLQIFEVEEAGHFPHREQATVVNKRLIEWLSQWRSDHL
jgi:pimeloyl-ACP methyl ester carboxylesterase